ncbi:myxococcus cysteine-rich repeat containing protein [Pendulispora brunnea]|uniref:Myxococcus cysteine-rich repeat containing protein n=1 Tax=Pendulispora brunnea TaxID=2905690 RepID=A0ABZ2KA92_9BACT
MRKTTRALASTNLLVLLTAAACGGTENSPPASVGDSESHSDGMQETLAIAATCGDGKIEGNEACDDYNTENGDGCSSRCGLEAGWSCTGQPTRCTPICGDGKLVGREECDDGDVDGGDGCSTTCKVEQGCRCAAGAPSACRCASIEAVTQTPLGVDTASLTVEPTGKAHIAYLYGLRYRGPNNLPMKDMRLVHAERGPSYWTKSEPLTWGQNEVSLEREDLVLASDGGALQTYFQRFFSSPGGSFVVGTRDNASWQFAYGDADYTYHAIRGGGEWHSLSRISGSLHYRVGAPGAFTRDETLTGFYLYDKLRLGYASNGDVYLANFTQTSPYTSYAMKLHRRVDATTWAPVYNVTTTVPEGSCVHPVSHQPLALPNGGMVVFEDGFENSKRWLRVHRLTGAGWIVEDVADLSWVGSNCRRGGSASWSSIRTIPIVDNLGRPHILYQVPYLSKIEDHYLDATGWKVRSFTWSGGLQDAVIDAAGNTHFAMTMAGNPQALLSYVRMDANAW